MRSSAMTSPLSALFLSWKHAGALVTAQDLRLQYDLAIPLEGPVAIVVDLDLLDDDLQPGDGLGRSVGAGRGGRSEHPRQERQDR
jgi:hypothetical protein